MSDYSENLKFSILVPVYNVEKYIMDCINSILGQTYTNFELILIDDGSTDDSGHICDECAEKDARIVVIHKENGGLNSAPREAIKVATGDWCLFLDSDDYLDVKTLEILARKILETESDCIYYGWNNVDEDGRKFGFSRDIEQEIIVEDKRELYSSVFLNNGFNSLCRKAVKRELLSNSDYSRFYKIRRGEDLLQSLEIFKASKKVLFLPVHLYNYRFNPNSITHTVAYETYSVNFVVREKVLQFLRDENVWDDKEYNEYWKCCVSWFSAEVVMVANFDTNYKTKKTFLEDIKNSQYYVNFINSKKYARCKKGLSKKEKLVWFMLSKNWDGMLLFIIKTHRLINRIIKPTK